MTEQREGGNRFGAHRVIEPEGVLPQPAQRLDNNMARIWDNEILVMRRKLREEYRTG